MVALWVFLYFATLLGLLYWRVPLLFSSIALIGVVSATTYFSPISWLGLSVLWLITLAPVLILNILPLRRKFLSRHAYKIAQKVIPAISSTERAALDAGDIWWEAELFQGAPRWKTLLNYPKPTLTAEEKAFLDGPVEEVCRLTNDWEVTHVTGDLSPQAWQFIKSNGFFGMIIPKSFGGLGFSALAHSEVIAKLSAHSVTLGTTVSVPNSLGPAELLLVYGTEQQKNYYLPRLARGEEIPCFALTSPDAGSDAASIPDKGIVCKGEFNGQETIGIRLTFDKRYITLAPVATVVGLAFKLYDPDHLLGSKTNIGITCALIPRNTAGLEIGDRHFPLNTSFSNGPVRGKNVFIPMEYIIGGEKMVGRGWNMLMECLAAGRAISLPSVTSGGAKLTAILTGAYARIRRQFNLPISQFEGVEEALASIAGNAYITEATRKMSTVAVDLGLKPAIVSAIAKFHVTERARVVVQHGMDVHGGKGICLGPNNYIGRGYQAAPISITVEGANILTRNMIIFGQGSVRCHPYAVTEMEAVSMEDQQKGLTLFDKALFGHLAYFIRNGLRAFVLSLSHGWLTRAPRKDGAERYWQHLTRFSAVFAFVSDLSMMTLGGGLKRKEKLSARLGDILSMLYLSSCVLKRFHDQGADPEELPLVKWALKDCLYHLEQQLNAFLLNFPIKPLAWLMRLVCLPLGTNMHRPGDQLEHAVARLYTKPCPTRTRTADGLYLNDPVTNPAALVEEAFLAILDAEHIATRVRSAVREHKLTPGWFDDQIDEAIAQKIISQIEGEQCHKAEKLRQQVIAVDSFKPGTLFGQNTNETPANLQSSTKATLQVVERKP
jgi:acyl-CoA dehydrogenase